MSGPPPASTASAWRWLTLWGPVVAYMALIFALSSTATPPLPGEIGDKTLHFVGYGGLGVLALHATTGGALAGLTAGTASAAWAIAAVYGMTDEYHQHFVPGRAADAADALADALGAAAAILAVWAFGIIARSRQSSGAATRRR